MVCNTIQCIVSNVLTQYMWWIQLSVSNTNYTKSTVMLHFVSSLCYSSFHFYDKYAPKQFRMSRHTLVLLQVTWYLLIKTCRINNAENNFIIRMLRKHGPASLSTELFQLFLPSKFSSLLPSIILLKWCFSCT